MTKIVEKLLSASATDSNSAVLTGLIKFWLISALIYLTFPISLGTCFVLPGPRRTRQLISALVHDFLQAILLLLAVVMLLSWGVWHFMGSLLGGSSTDACVWTTITE